MDENRKIDFKINNIAGAFDLDRMMVKIAVGLIIIPIIVFYGVGQDHQFQFLVQFF